MLELSREGQSANATFRSIYPFDFELHDDVQSDTLYISPDEKTIEFKIRNRATKGVYFEDRFPAHNVDRDNYIFELRFRPRTFADPAGVKASLDRWQASPLTVDPVDGSQSFYFRGFGRLEPGQALSGLLTYRNVNAALGSRSTQMMLQYQRACFDNGSSFNGTRLKHLSVHTAAPAGATLPLHALLAMGSGVLNLRNGGAPPTFALEVFNVASSPLKIREGTRFALSFDDPSQPRSLLDPESIKSLVITLLDTNGSVAGEVTATDQKSPLWVIDWPVLENLDFNVEADAAGRYFDLSEERGFRIQIEGLICNRPSGFGRVRIQYSNLEGHGDGELSVPVLKSPLVAEDGRVGIGTASPVALLHLIDQKREAPRRDTLDGGVPALLLGPPGESHLSFGYDNDYSWLQSGGNHRILKVNPAGGDVEVGGSIRAEAGLRLGPWRLVDWGAPGKTPGLHLSCEPHSIVFQITGRRRLQIQGSVEAAGELVAEVVRAPTIRADSITAKAVVAPILTAESVLNARMARVTESINAAHFVGGEFSGSNVQVREVKTREIKIGDPDAGSKKSIQIDQDGIRIGNWRIQAHEGTYPGHLYFYNIESGKPVYTFAQHGVWGPGFNKGGLSDLRLKTDLQDIGATLPRIRAIRGMRFRWLDHEKIRDRAGSTDIGMLAQEVEAVYPELVTVDSDGYRSVDYGKFGAVLLEGLKEADEKIESQAGRIDALEAEMRELRGKLTRILEKVDI
ncbi:MAG: tail fiber domain-containing protein [Leptospirales bacterium]